MSNGGFMMENLENTFQRVRVRSFSAYQT